MINWRGFLIGLTQWLNGTLNGNPDVPFSTRAAIEAETGRRSWVIVEALIDLIFAIVTGERDHCRASANGNEN